MYTKKEIQNSLSFHEEFITGQYLPCVDGNNYVFVQTPKNYLGDYYTLLPYSLQNLIIKNTQYPQGIFVPGSGSVFDGSNLNIGAESTFPVNNLFIVGRGNIIVATTWFETQYTQGNTCYFQPLWHYNYLAWT